MLSTSSSHHHDNEDLLKLHHIFNDSNRGVSMLADLLGGKSKCGLSNRHTRSRAVEVRGG